MADASKPDAEAGLDIIDLSQEDPIPLPGAVPDASTESPKVSSPTVSVPKLLEELSKVDSSSWQDVLDALRRHGQPDLKVLRELMTKSAEKLNFWSDDKLLDSCCRVVQKRLAGKTVDTDRVAADKDEERKEASLASLTHARRTGPEKGELGAKDSSRKGSKVLAFARQISPFSQHSSSFARHISNPSKETCMTGTSELMMGYSMSFTKSDDMLDQCVKDASAHFNDEAKAICKAEQLLPADKAAGRLRQFKYALFFFVLFQMVLFAVYVVFYMTPKTWDVIGFPILVARGSAYGACFWTAILFLTMSRDLISFFASVPCVQNSQLMMQLINCHKELHVFSAYEVLLDGFLHALMHHIGTFVALETNDIDKINEMLVCAQSNKNIPDGYIGKAIANFLSGIQYPACPLPQDADVGYFDGVLSTPGITGYLLLLVISALGWFSRAKKRKTNFRLFYWLHQLLVPAWVILLVLHGANDWVGLGFPLVLLVAAVPVLIYLWTRIRRSYLSILCQTKVVNVQKSVNGKLLRLEVEVSTAWRKCKVGQYAYINVPAISLTEWHPYTICNSTEGSKGEQVMTFCIMNVGKWTKQLHAVPKLLDCKVHIDGPFYAPTVSMPTRSTVVGIGAGVGVTPFLSFLGGLAGPHPTGHKSAHVFWMSAWATDFLLFQDLFTQLDEKRALTSGNTTTFHLHATPRFGGWDGKGLGCLFDLASKDVWDDWVKRLETKDSDKVPTFSRYPKPLHAVISKDFVAAGNPVAVVMGSPDFVAELLAIGDADRSEDVFVYFCGNPFLQNMIQSACIICNKHRVENGEQQRYYFYFERFG